MVSSKAVEPVAKAVGKYIPSILTAIGVTGMVTSTVMAVKATPEALDLKAEAECEKSGDDFKIKKLKPLELVQACWRPYVPAACVGALSIGCLVGSNVTSVKRNAALTSAYILSQDTLAKFREKVIEEVGDKKYREIDHKVLAEQTKEGITKTAREVEYTGKGDTLCYDRTCNRIFRHDIDKLRKIENEINHMMTKEGDEWISLNDVYYEIGLKPTSIGDLLGWSLHGNGLVDFKFGSTLHPMTDEPCLTIDFDPKPKYTYNYN